MSRDIYLLMAVMLFFAIQSLEGMAKSRDDDAVSMSVSNDGVRQAPKRGFGFGKTFRASPTKVLKSKFRDSHLTIPFGGGDTVGSIQLSRDPSQTQPTDDQSIIFADRDEKIQNFDDHSSELNIFVDSTSQEVGEAPHGSYFHCLNCTCSYTFRGKILVDCRNQKWNFLSSGLPVKAWSLNMANNLLGPFITRDILSYRFLENLTLSFNSNVRRIVNNSGENRTSVLTYFDVSSCKIRTIDDGSFRIMPRLNHLILRDNQLYNLTNSMFVGLENLQILDLGQNQINYIEVGTFDYLISLKTLDLSLNRALGYSEKRFSPSLFVKLKRLRDLYIQGNTPSNAKYPDKVLQQLINLQHLRVNGMSDGVNFGPEVKSLKYFRHLEIIGTVKAKCNLKSISESFFENTPNLQSFAIENCKLSHINSSAYTKVKNLKRLSISHMANYELSKAFQELDGLQNSSLTILRFNNLYHGGYPCRFLKGNDAKFIRNINLEELDLSSNLLALLGDDFLQNLPRSLERLILRQNKFAGKEGTVLRLGFMKELIELDISEQMPDITYYSYLNPKGISCPKDSNSGLGRWKLFSDAGHANLLTQEIKSPCDWEGIEFQGMDDTIHNEVPDYRTGKSKYEGGNLTPQTSFFKPLPIPPNLQILRSSEYTAPGMILLTNGQVTPNNSLIEVDFSRSFMQFWGQGSMPKGIKKANLNNNFCTGIKKTFFKPNNSLIHLEVNNNILGSDFANDDAGDIFAELSKTVYLDLSTNLIYELPRNFLKGLRNLRTLLLSDNKLQILNTSMSHLKQLKYLDLSKNSLTWIAKETRDELDAIAADHQLQIDLSLNPLPCTCTGIELLRWIESTKAIIMSKDFLKCRLDDGKTENVGNLTVRVNYLQRFCVGRAMIVVICVASITVLAVIVGFATIYRYRWKLRYLRNITIAKFYGFKPMKTVGNERKFDAYFVYTDETSDFVLNDCLQELEVKRGHKLCIEDRDFMVGTFIVSNIVSAVQNSTKVIPVVTPDFYDGTYSEYAIKMAVNEELYNQRSLLHLCIYQPTSSEGMSRDLLMAMKRNDYTEFPPEDEANVEIRQNVWDHLSRAIGHTGNREDEPRLDL